MYLFSNFKIKIKQAFNELILTNFTNEMRIMVKTILIRIDIWSSLKFSLHFPI